jgi:hypothetical protein
MRRNTLSLLLILSVCSLYNLNAQSGRWEVVKTVNAAPNCSECGMAAVDGKLYLIGNDSNHPTPVEVFDPSSLTWTKLAETLVVMHHFQAVPYKTRIYILDAFSDGGFPDQVPMSNVYSYDVKNNTWGEGW